MEKHEQLYEKLKGYPPESVFYQHDFLTMGVATDAAELLTLLQSLMDGHRLQIFSQDGDACYKYRSEEDAQK